jgi:hypothetical protein
MKVSICFAIALMLLLSAIGCRKDDNPAAPTVIATEEWGFIMDNDTSNHGQTTFQKRSDGSVTGNATWYFNNQGEYLVCSFEGGAVTIVDTVISISAHGTATYTGAPAGYNSSPFTITISGIVHNGSSLGTWDIAFSGYGWPSSKTGTFTATRSSGSGVTN